MSQKNAEQSVFERIYAVVKRIPQGKVATYGQVALVAGNPRWARVVGYALHSNPDPEHIPCYRVVNRDGRVSPAFVFGGQKGVTDNTVKYAVKHGREILNIYDTDPVGDIISKFKCTAYLIPPEDEK